jgi:hypothetical protein
MVDDRGWLVTAGAWMLILARGCTRLASTDLGGRKSRRRIAPATRTS